MTTTLHEQSHPETAWATVNISEALPGVVTPLTWSFWGAGLELATRRAYHRMGVLPRHRVRVDPDPSLRLVGVFFGRAAINIDGYRELADLKPGISGDRAERDILGRVREGVGSHSTMRRLPFVATRLPWQFATISRRLRVFLERQQAWWWAQVQPERASAPPAVALMAAQERFVRAMELHAYGSTACFGVFAQMSKVAEQAGRPGLENQLLTGYAHLVERELVDDLGRLASGALGMRGFLARHGYHGDREGELSSRSWREEPARAQTWSDRYGEGHAAGSGLASASPSDRASVEAELLAGLGSRRRRLMARLVLQVAPRIVPLREDGKVAFVMAIDAARAAARRGGTDLVTAGHLDDPEDVFFLTLDELTAPVPPVDLRSPVAERRRSHAEYQAIRLPEYWIGQPSPDSEATGFGPADPGLVQSIPVVPGVVEGPVLVARDLSDTEAMTPGTILVCHTTDPSWAAVFPLAAGLVIDIGGAMSHGAIVARELGVPCIINTRHGTSTRTSGAWARLDGGAGTLRLVSVRGHEVPA